MTKKTDSDENNPFVYIPSDAGLNFKNTNQKPPKTKYDKRQVAFGREEVKKVIKKDIGL